LAVGGEVAGPELQDFLAAVLATGAEWPEAMGQAALAHGADAVLPDLIAKLKATRLWFGGGAHASAVLAILSDLGEIHPDLARQVFAEWGRGRTVDSDLHLGHLPWVTGLPEGMRVRGYLNLRGLPIRVLPQRLTVGGTLWLDGTLVEAVPAGVRAKGSLKLTGTPVVTLPKGFRVGGGLYLTDTPIAHLPEGLGVDGPLVLSGTQVKELPRNLKVGGGLTLDGTPIRALPPGLVTAGAVSLRDCPAWNQHVPADADPGHGRPPPRGILGELATAARLMPSLEFGRGGVCTCHLTQTVFKHQAKGLQWPRLAALTTCLQMRKFLWADQPASVPV
jgi:hypothetical protein